MDSNILELKKKQVDLEILSNELHKAYINVQHIPKMIMNPYRDTEFDEEERIILHERLCYSRLLIQQKKGFVRKLKNDLKKLLKIIFRTHEYVPLTEKLSVVKELPFPALIVQRRGFDNIYRTDEFDYIHHEDLDYFYRFKRGSLSGEEIKRLMRREIPTGLF